MRELNTSENYVYKEIPNKLVEYISHALGTRGIAFFMRARSLCGSVNGLMTEKEAQACWSSKPLEEVLPKEKGRFNIPHPIHFQEGMFVRNQMRNSGCCDNWTDEELDNYWTLVVNLVLEKKDSL